MSKTSLNLPQLIMRLSILTLDPTDNSLPYLARGGQGVPRPHPATGFNASKGVDTFWWQGLLVNKCGFWGHTVNCWLQMLTVCQLSSSFGRLPESTRFGLNCNASTLTLTGTCSVLQASLICKSAGTNHAQCVNTFLNKLVHLSEALIPNWLQNHKTHPRKCKPGSVKVFIQSSLVSSTSSHPKSKWLEKHRMGGK
jgi:hypothetical protein